MNAATRSGGKLIAEDAKVGVCRAGELEVSDLDRAVMARGVVLFRGHGTEAAIRVWKRMLVPRRAPRVAVAARLLFF